MISRYVMQWYNYNHHCEIIVPEKSSIIESLNLAFSLIVDRKTDLTIVILKSQMSYRCRCKLIAANVADLIDTRIFSRAPTISQMMPYNAPIR